MKSFIVESVSAATATLFLASVVSATGIASDAPSTSVSNVISTSVPDSGEAACTGIESPCWQVEFSQGLCDNEADNSPEGHAKCLCAGEFFTQWKECRRCLHQKDQCYVEFLDRVITTVSTELCQGTPTAKFPQVFESVANRMGLDAPPNCDVQSKMSKEADIVEDIMEKDGTNEDAKPKDVAKKESKQQDVTKEDTNEINVTKEDTKVDGVKTEGSKMSMGNKIGGVGHEGHVHTNGTTTGTKKPNTEKLDVDSNTTTTTTERGGRVRKSSGDFNDATNEDNTDTESADGEVNSGMATSPMTGIALLVAAGVFLLGL